MFVFSDLSCRIPLNVNKMTSDFHWPVDYYQLPYCRTLDEMVDNNTWNKNLKELLTGDRIQPSPYRLFMKEDLYCQQLCISNLGLAESKKRPPNKVVQFIRKNYHNNWIVDNLKSATKFENDKTVTTVDQGGFPIGFVNVNDERAYIHNHVNLEIEYAPVETQDNKFRIVKFTVQPFSIRHDFDEADITDDTVPQETESRSTKPRPDVKVAEMKNPIPSCKPGATQHTSYDMVFAPGRDPQPASSKTLFTYDVIWKENREAKWPTQWKVYVSTDTSTLSIASNLFMFLVLTAVVTAILVRRWRRDVARYECLTKADEETQDEHSSMDYAALLNGE